MLEPIPETVEAIEELTRYGGDDLGAAFLGLIQKTQPIVPELVGLSLGILSEGVTFTAVSTGQVVSALDATQYLDGGPCVDSADLQDVVSYAGDDPTDEARWSLFARASAAAGVLSTLSLPILGDGHVSASVNLYASTRDAFAGRAEQLADACHAWAPGAVADADLEFRTRHKAQEAPERIRDQNQVDQALGMLMAARGLTYDEALQRLELASNRAGLPPETVARVLIASLVGDPRRTEED